jgi:hypothetical protein
MCGFFVEDEIYFCPECDRLANKGKKAQLTRKIKAHHEKTFGLKVDDSQKEKIDTHLQRLIDAKESLMVKKVAAKVNFKPTTETDK